MERKIDIVLCVVLISVVFLAEPVLGSLDLEGWRDLVDALYWIALGSGFVLLKSSLCRRSYKMAILALILIGEAIAFKSSSI